MSSSKSRAIPLLHLWTFVACSSLNFTFYPYLSLLIKINVYDVKANYKNDVGNQPSPF